MRICDLSTGLFYESQTEAARMLGLQQADVSRSVRKGHAVRSHLFVNEEDWMVWTTFIIRDAGYAHHPQCPGWCVQTHPATKIVEEFIAARKRLPGVAPELLKDKDNEYLQSLSQP
jgi:hypothetical protein